MSPNPQFPADLVTFTEEFLNGKLHFLCSELKNTSTCNHVLPKIFSKFLVVPDGHTEAYSEPTQTYERCSFLKN